MAEHELSDTTISVEVAYAKPFEQKIVSVKVANGTTIYEAAKQSGIAKHFPEIDFKSVKLGVFGKAIIKPHEQAVKAGDRIEIYRPLIADPKEVRKRRAEQARLKKQDATTF